MSVENCPPPAPKTAAAASSASHGAGKAKGRAAQGEAGGFSELLNLLDAAAQAAVPGADLVADALQTPMQGDAKLKGQGKGQSKDDAASVDASLLLAQSLQVPLAVESVQVTPDAGGAQHPVLEVPTLNPVVQRAQARGVDGPALAEAVRAPVAELAKGPAPQRALRPGTPDTTAALQAAAASANPTASNLPALTPALAPRAPEPPRPEPVAAEAPALVVAGLGETSVRRAEHAHDASASGRSSGDDGAWGPQALVSAGRSDDPTAMTDLGVGMPPEVAVAEQVNYWIQRDVQKAEITLDSLGGSPVQVNISLQGNEALVEFRTDLPQAQQVLEGSMTHLRELLGNEGLVLSGMSVGSSGADNAASQQQRDRQERRQATVAVPQAAAVDAPVRPTRAAAGALDLFV